MAVVIALLAIGPSALGEFVGAAAENIDPVAGGSAAADIGASADAGSGAAPGWDAWRIGSMALHIAWAVAAVVVIVRRRWLRVRPVGIAEVSPTSESVAPAGAGVMLIAAGVAVYCAQYVGAASAMAILGRGDAAAGIVGAEADLWRKVGAHAGQYVGAAAAVVFVVMMVPGAARLMGLPRRWFDALRGVVRGIAGIAVVYPMAWAMGWVMALVVEWVKGAEGMESVAHSTLREIAASPRDLAWWSLVGLVVVCAPVFEEIVYRGLLQPGAALVLGRPWMAILGTSAMFAMMHAGAVSWHALPVLFVLSVGLGVARVRTGGVVAPMVMHAAFNAANVVLVGV
jgi:membrane protease YdiL (CAAX protease family)